MRHATHFCLAAWTGDDRLARVRRAHAHPRPPDYLSGPQIPLVTLLNFTSLWLNDTLFMYTFATPLDDVPK